jgi:hypothetical protein
MADLQRHAIDLLEKQFVNSMVDQLEKPLGLTSLCNLLTDSLTLSAIHPS